MSQLCPQWGPLAPHWGLRRLRDSAFATLRGGFLRERQGFHFFAIVCRIRTFCLHKAICTQCSCTYCYSLCEENNSCLLSGGLCASLWHLHWKDISASEACEWIRQGLPLSTSMEPFAKKGQHLHLSGEVWRRQCLPHACRGSHRSDSVWGGAPKISFP